MQFRNSSRLVALAVVAVLMGLFIANVVAHESRLVGDNEYYVTVGYSTEPAYTDVLNGLDLFLRTPDGEWVPFQEDNLSAELISPDGNAKMDLSIRARYGEPGQYTADFVLTEPGVYSVRIWGEINGVSFDETYELDEVTPLSAITFPARD